MAGRIFLTSLGLLCVAGAHASHDDIVSLLQRASGATEARDEAVSAASLYAKKRAKTLAEIQRWKDRHAAGQSESLLQGGSSRKSRGNRTKGEGAVAAVQKWWSKLRQQRAVRKESKAKAAPEEAAANLNLVRQPHVEAANSVVAEAETNASKQEVQAEVAAAPVAAEEQAKTTESKQEGQVEGAASGVVEANATASEQEGQAEATLGNSSSPLRAAVAARAEGSTDTNHTTQLIRDYSLGLAEDMASSKASARNTLAEKTRQFMKRELDKHREWGSEVKEMVRKDTERWIRDNQYKMDKEFLAQKKLAAKQMVAELAKLDPAAAEDKKKNVYDKKLLKMQEWQKDYLLQMRMAQLQWQKGYFADKVHRQRGVPSPAVNLVHKQPGAPKSAVNLVRKQPGAPKSAVNLARKQPGAPKSAVNSARK